MNTKRNVFLLAIMLAAGCASAPPTGGSSLQETKELLASPDAEELQHEFPRLFEDANEALRNAEKAQKAGNLTDRDLYNTIALSKFESARNLSRANEYQARRSAMSNAAYALTNELADVKQEQLVVNRYKQLDKRFEKATERLENYKGDEQKARAAIARARRLQSRAIYVGASNSTPTLYGKGEKYIETSLAQLEKGNPKAATVLAKRATTTFDQAIDKAQTTAVAQRRAEENKQEKEIRQGERALALKAIDSAVTARSKALEAGADSKSANLFNAGDYRLEQARAAVKNSRYTRATQLADRAADIYSDSYDKALKVVAESKKVAPAPAPVPDAAAGVESVKIVKSKPPVEKVIVQTDDEDTDKTFFSAKKTPMQEPEEEVALLPEKPVRKKVITHQVSEKPEKDIEEEESYDLLSASTVKEAKQKAATSAPASESSSVQPIIVKVTPAPAPQAQVVTIPTPTAPQPQVVAIPTPAAPQPQVVAIPTPAAPQPQVVAIPTPAAPQPQVVAIPTPAPAPAAPPIIVKVTPAPVPQAQVVSSPTTTAPAQNGIDDDDDLRRIDTEDDRGYYASRRRPIEDRYDRYAQYDRYDRYAGYPQGPRPYGPPVQPQYPYPYQGYPVAGGYPQPYMPPAPYPVPYPVPLYQPQPFVQQVPVPQPYVQQIPVPQPIQIQQPQPQYQQQSVAPQQPSLSEAFLRNKVVEKLSAMQLQRAELLGRSSKGVCSGDALNEFDAILNIAKDRLATNDLSLALEYLTRAEERLKNCKAAPEFPPVPLSPISPTDELATQEPPAPQQRARQRQAPVPVDPTLVIEEDLSPPQSAPVATQQVQFPQSTPQANAEIESLEKSARQAAIEAINDASIDIARARTNLSTNPTRLKSADLLLKRARDEFNKKDYANSTVSALRASNVLAGEENGTPLVKQSETTTFLEEPVQAPAAPQPQPEPVAQQTPAPAPAATPAPQPENSSVVKVEDATPQCQGNIALINVVREKQNQVATPEDVNQLVLAANDLNLAGRCKEASLFYQQALSKLYTIAVKAEQPAPAPTEPQAPAASPEDQVLMNQATISVANAEEKRAAKARFESDPSYQVGLRLLSSARDRLREGNYQTALLFAKEASGSFDNVVETAPAPAAQPEAQAAQQQQPAGPNTAALDQDPRRFRREYNQVLDALVARDRARDRVSEASRETFDRGLDFLGKARRAWGAQDYQGAGRLAVEAKKEFDSIKTPAPKPPEPPKVDNSAEKEKEAKKKEALSLLESARKARRDCESASCRARDDRAFLEAVGRVVDAETAIATEQFDATIAAANDALAKFKKLMALPKPVQPSSPYLSLQEDQLVLNPRITFETGSSNISGEAAPSVQAAADFFKEFGDRIISITIAGYTDSIGNAGKNQRLSASRAEAVAQALKAQGVNVKMSAVGYGENNPIASNKTADGREQNRRVEIRFKTQG